MPNFILRRMILLFPVLLIVSFISFSLIYLAPGDPAEILLTSPQGGVDQKAVEEFRLKMGMDQPLYIQYIKWLSRAVRGDLGYSYMTDQDVFGEILESFSPTLRLAVASLIISLVLALPLGILSALNRKSIIDYLGMAMALIGVSIPNFWMAYLLLLLFSVSLGLLPVAGFGSNGDIEHLILPAFTLGISAAAVTSRMIRSSMLEVMSQDYITAARARGLPETVIVMRHALKNAFIPVITVIGLNIGHLLNGSVVVETIFAWPGIGRLMVESIYDRDYPMIQGCILFVALIFLSVNLVVDIAYHYLNPRIKYEIRD
ncbi:MAG: nickel ABC transporter permease [Methanotrichaceae archaeon]